MGAIPVERCLGGRDLTEPRLHPDGTRMVVVVASEGVAALVVYGLDDGSVRALSDLGSKINTGTISSASAMAASSAGLSFNLRSLRNQKIEVLAIGLYCH